MTRFRFITGRSPGLGPSAAEAVLARASGGLLAPLPENPFENQLIRSTQDN